MQDAAGAPPTVSGAPWRPVSIPSPAASTPISSTPASPTNGANVPIAFEPPPTQARTRVGQPARRSRICARASSPITRWRSRTITGNGAGPTAEPMHVVRVGDVRDPVADRRGDGLLERPRPGVDRRDRRAQHPHALDVGRLAADVLGAHVHDALEPEQRARGGRGDAVLAGAGLGDDPRLAHALGEQRLAERVVDLVRAGVVEVLALEPDLAARRLAEPLGVVERRGAADVVAQQRASSSR